MTAYICDGHGDGGELEADERHALTDEQPPEGGVAAAGRTSTATRRSTDVIVRGTAGGPSCWLRSGQVVRGADDVDDTADDLGDAVVLGREHRGHALLDQPARVGVGDDAADHDRHVARARLAQQPQHVGHQLEVRAGQDRQADAVDVLLDGGGAIWAGVSRMPW